MLLKKNKRMIKEIKDLSLKITYASLCARSSGLLIKTKVLNFLWFVDHLVV